MDSILVPALRGEYAIVICMRHTLSWGTRKVVTLVAPIC